MEEEWRDVVGYEGLYQVSNLGKVKRLKGTVLCVGEKQKPFTITVYETILKLSDKKHGYIHCALSKNGKLTTRTVHRLVMETFVPNPDNLPQVNHIDGDKSNNKISNLEWSSSSHNIRHALENKLRIPPVGEMTHKAILTEEIVINIRKLRASGVKLRELSEMYNCDISTINGVVYNVN